MWIAALLVSGSATAQPLRRVLTNGDDVPGSTGGSRTVTTISVIELGEGSSVMMTGESNSPSHEAANFAAIDELGPQTMLGLANTAAPGGGMFTNPVGAAIGGTAAVMHDAINGNDTIFLYEPGKPVVKLLAVGDSLPGSTPYDGYTGGILVNENSYVVVQDLDQRIILLKPGSFGVLPLALLKVGDVIPGTLNEAITTIGRPYLTDGNVIVCEAETSADRYVLAWDETNSWTVSAKATDLLPASTPGDLVLLGVSPDGRVGLAITYNQDYNSQTVSQVHIRLGTPAGHVEIAAFSNYTPQSGDISPPPPPLPVASYKWESATFTHDSLNAIVANGSHLVMGAGLTPTGGGAVVGGIIHYTGGSWQVVVTNNTTIPMGAGLTGVSLIDANGLGQVLFTKGFSDGLWVWDPTLSSPDYRNIVYQNQMFDVGVGSMVPAKAYRTFENLGAGYGRVFNEAGEIAFLLEYMHPTTHLYLHSAYVTQPAVPSPDLELTTANYYIYQLDIDVTNQGNAAVTKMRVRLQVPNQTPSVPYFTQDPANLSECTHSFDMAAGTETVECTWDQAIDPGNTVHLAARFGAVINSTTIDVSVFPIGARDPDLSNNTKTATRNPVDGVNAPNDDNGCGDCQAGGRPRASSALLLALVVLRLRRRRRRTALST